MGVWVAWLLERGFEEAVDAIVQRWGGTHLDDPRGQPPLGQVQAQGAPLRWRVRVLLLRRLRLRVRVLLLLGQVIKPGRSRARPGGHCSLLGSRWHGLGARSLLRLLLQQLSERRAGVGGGGVGGGGCRGASTLLLLVTRAFEEQVAHSPRWLRHPCSCVN